MGGAFLYNELIDMVIDYLHDDKLSLVSCTLVSRTWRNSGQFHLLEDITLTGVASPRGLEAFMALVERVPRIGYCVRALRVHGEGAWFGKYSSTELHKLCLGRQHLEFLAQLPGLRRLLLHEVLWDASRENPDSLSAPEFVPRLNKLDKLVVHHVSSLPTQEPGQIHQGIYAQDVLDILSFFPSIDVLRFATARFEVYDDTARLPNEQFLQLHFPPSLRVGSLEVDPEAEDGARSALAYTLFDRACALDGPHTFAAKVKPGDLDAVSHFVSVRGPAIRHYKLDMSAYFTLTRVGECLSRVASSFEDTDLSPRNAAGAQQTFARLQLAACPNLESFELRTPCFPPARLWQYILVALAALPRTLRRARVCVYLTSTLPMSAADACAGLTDGASPSLALEHMTAFPRLEALEFVLKHPHGGDAVYPYRYGRCARMVEELVPEALRARGVLQVVPCGCFGVPTPEPTCLSILNRTPLL
jgi:hypothetical protein